MYRSKAQWIGKRRRVAGVVVAALAVSFGVSGTPARADTACSPGTAPATSDEFALNVTCAPDSDGPITVLPDDGDASPPLGFAPLAATTAGFNTLEGLIENVPRTPSGIPQPAEGSKFQVTEAVTGERITSLDIIPNPFVSPNFPYPYLSIYHFDLGDGSLGLRIGGSFDLATFTRIRDLVVPVNRLGGSQGTLRYVPSTGGFLLAYERQVARFPAGGPGLADDRIDSRIQLRYYPNVLNLALGIPTEQRDLPRAFGTKLNDGTPSIRQITWGGSLNTSTISLGFHYNATTGVDREASGTLAGGTWSPKQDTAIDAAIRNSTAAKFLGNYGQRREFTFQGNPYRIYEAQLVKDDSATWRLLLYDVANKQIKRLSIRTPGGSQSFANPATAMVEPSPVLPPNGVPRGNALILYTFIHQAKAGVNESGSLVYYRAL